MGNKNLEKFNFVISMLKLCQVIPFEEWPDEFFPTNCWGVVYIMSSVVRNKLLKVNNVEREHHHQPFYSKDNLS